MDQIIIKELELYSNHGVYKEEKVLGQKFLVSAVLYTDTKRAGKSDKIEYSVNYGGSMPSDSGDHGGKYL